MAYDPDVLASLREQNPGVADDIILAALDMQSQQDTMPVRPDLSRESSMRNYVGDTRNDTDIIESDGVVSPTTHQVPTFMELTGGGGSRPSNKRSDSDRVPTFMELTSGMSTEPTSTPAANSGDGNFTRGAKTAIGQTVPLAKGLVGAISATGEQVFGEGGIWSGLKDWGIKGYQDGMAKLQPLARENDDITVAWEKAKSGDLGALMDWAAYGLGYGAVQLGESALTGGIGALAAKGGAGILAKTAVENMVAKQAAKISAEQSAKIATGELTEAAIAKMATTQVANRIAAMGAGTALQGYNEMMEVGSIFPDAVEEANKHGGMTGEDLARVWGWGTLAAATESATDLLGLGAITGKIKLPGAGGRIARGVTGSMIGGVTEGAQEGVQTWMEWKGANKDTDSEAFWKDFINSAAMGALPGHVVGGVAGAVHVPKPADILNTPNTQQAIDTFNAAIQADATASEDVRAIGALMQDYTAANRQTLEAAQAQLDAESDQGDPLAVANPADVTNAAALARTTQADQKIAATLSDEEQGIGIPPAAADTNNLPDTSAPITGQRSLAQQVLEISRNGGPKSEAERGLMAMARRDLGEQKVAEIERLGQAPALMTRMEQKGVEHGATPPITIVPNDNGVPIIRSQTPEISTAVNAELKSAGINTHTIDGTSIRVPKAQGQVAQQIVSRVNTRFTQPRQEQPLGTQAEETVPTEQGQPESQPAAPLTLGNANHAQSATVRAMLGDQVSAEDHVGVIDNLDTLPTQVDANQGPRIGRPMAKAIKTLAGMLGRKVVFYETTNKEVAEGINRDGNTLYVNIDSNVDAVAVAGHEMVHSIEHEQPETYKALLDATKDVIKAGGRARSVAYAKYAGVRDLDSAARELLSDIGGNEWRSGQFWSDVFDEVHRTHAPTEARSIITKIRDAVVAFINKLIRATPKQGFQHGYTREELAEIRDNLVKATAESFRRAERVRLGLAPTPEAKAGEVRFAGKREEDADNEPTRVFVEVAPDPNNSALTEAWRSQPYDERVAMSRSVFQKILPKVLSALGIKGEFSEQLGGYKLDTNPSFAALFDNANDAHRFSLLAGYALSQDSMMVLSGQKFDGAMDAGIIQIKLPGSATQEQVHQVYLAARGTWPGKISGHTTKDGIMHIVVPRKTALQVAMKVNKALGNKYPVHHAEGYYAFPQKKDYDYASIQGTSSAQLPGTREDASELRAEANRLIRDELAKRGASFSQPRQASDAAGGGREIEQSRSDGTSGQGVGGRFAETAQGSKPGSISGLGVHYSANQRKTLVSSFFGSGLKGAELERVKSASDDRIKHRIYFYLNTGRGINPEAGVGSHAHTLKLNNLYDVTADQLDLRVGRDANEFESALIDAGYDGYMTQESGIAVLLGQRVVTPDYIGSGIKPDVPLAGRAEPSAYGKAQRALADRRDLPSGQMKGREWQKALPEMDLSHLDTDAYYYKDALLERPRFSAPRAQPWYYSQLEQGVRTMPAKVSGTSANNVALWLKSNADKLKIKKEEVEWSGVMDYLASLGKEKVTAEQLADWVAKNGVKIEEVVLGAKARASRNLRIAITGEGDTDLDYSQDDWIKQSEILERQAQSWQRNGDNEKAQRYFELSEEAAALAEGLDPESGSTAGMPKHASGNLVLPGGTDHREIVLTVPSVEPYNESDSTHYGDVGKGKAIAWARVNTRTDADGKKVLFVEEIQSQRNQHGRTKGFDTASARLPANPATYADIVVGDEIKGWGTVQAIRDGANGKEFDVGGLWITEDRFTLDKVASRDSGHLNAGKNKALVPTAPFVSTKDGKPVDSYISLILKRLIAYAVDTGHDRISWTTGEQQADRYDLSKQIKSITAHRSDEPAGTFYSLEAIGTNGRPLEELGQMYRAEQLEEVLGKDLAEKIINQPDASKTYSGLDLKVGGGWTASMYGDSRGLDAKGKPSMIAAAARKLGAEVGVVDIDQTPKGGVLHFRAASEGGTYRAAEEKALMQQPGFTITPAMQEQASKGMPLFSKQRIIGDSGRQYTNEQKDLFKHVGREVDEKTTLEKLKSWIGKNWAQGLFDQFAPVKSLSNHAYALMRLSKGATGAFEAFMRHGKLSIRDGAYDADTSGGVIDQVFIPLGKETTDFLYWIAGNRAERLVAEDREHLFTQAHIAAAKSLATGDTDFDYTLSNGTVTRKRALIFRDALKKFNDFSKNALDMAEQSGLIDGASRQYWEHEFYVPFYRVVDEKDGGIRGMNIKQGVVRQKAFEMLNGGEEKLGDLLSNTLMNWAHLIDASAKNRAAKATIDAAVNLGAARKAVAGEKNVVWYSDKGRKAEFVVDDPGLLVALNGLEYAGLRGPAMDALSATKHWLTMGVTASPFFKVRNLIRDSIQSIAVSDLSYNPLHNVKEGWKLTNRASQEYVSALAGGGLIRFGTMLEGSEAARTRQLIKQGSKDSHILDGEGKLKAFYDKVIEPAWSKYQELGNRGEEINRMALYDKLIVEGKTHAEAALAARDLMDFSMSGAFTSVRFLTQVVPFLNARLQGLYKLGKGAKEDKARFAIVMATTALAGLAMMGYASGDDDRWKRWKKREQWDKDNYWMFSFGDVDYRIPKPFEIGAMATLVERGFETAFMLGDEKNKWSKFGYAVLKIASDQLSMNPVPQLVKPILDIYANKDSFSGRPIETMSMERLKKDYRFNAGTSMFARGASTAGNTIADVAGMEFLSPVQIDHLVRSYFGWVGAAAVASADFAIRPMTNEPSRPEKDMLKWMSGGMVTDKDSAGSRYVSHLYDQLGELESAYGTWQQLRKEGKADDAREFAADHRDELRQYRQSENVKQRLSEMNKQIRMIERSDRHPAEKRILINRIRARQSDMAERLN